MFHPEYYCNAKFRSPCGPALLNASWTQLGVLGFTSALQLSPWRGVRCRRWRAGEGPHPTRRPPTPYAPEENPGCPPASEDQLFIGGAGGEGPTTPSLGSTYWLEQIAELRERFHFLHHWLMPKEHHPRSSQWKGCRRQGPGGKAWALTSSPGVPLPPDALSTPAALHTPSFCVFRGGCVTQVSSTTSSSTGGSFALQPPLPSLEVGAESQITLYSGVVPLATSTRP